MATFLTEPNSILHIQKKLSFSAKAAPFRIEFISDGIEDMVTATTIADLGSKGLKLYYWQNSC